MSYGIDAPQGLVPVVQQSYTSFIPALIASGYNQPINCNDPVSQLADGTIIVGAQATTNTTVGVFAGCQYIGSDGIPVYSKNWVANTVTTGTGSGTNQGAYAMAMVIADPRVQYSIQTNSINGLPLTSIGANANYTNPLSAPGALGYSTVALDQSTLNPTNTLNLKIVGLDMYPGNRWSVGNDFGYNNVLVTINNSTFNVGVTGI